MRSFVPNIWFAPTIYLSIIQVQCLFHNSPRVSTRLTRETRRMIVTEKSLLFDPRSSFQDWAINYRQIPSASILATDITGLSGLVSPFSHPGKSRIYFWPWVGLKNRQLSACHDFTLSLFLCKIHINPRYWTQDTETSDKLTNEIHKIGAHALILCVLKEWTSNKHNQQELPGWFYLNRKSMLHSETQLYDKTVTLNTDSSKLIPCEWNRRTGTMEINWSFRQNLTKNCQLALENESRSRSTPKQIMKAFIGFHLFVPSFFSG